ncbi:hypothetical protein [Spiroplasma endosymbiont of Virgichneumon dumeticola]|uniref:hypothetical protein n=1 Tax=Spiroplasma endosymbiont of Virgichneumon dumeticola TaxID=3139323 RepID=UPI0035C909C8
MATSVYRPVLGGHIVINSLFISTATPSEQLLIYFFYKFYNLFTSTLFLENINYISVNKINKIYILYAVCDRIYKKRKDFKMQIEFQKEQITEKSNSILINYGEYKLSVPNWMIKNNSFMVDDKYTYWVFNLENVKREMNGQELLNLLQPFLAKQKNNG